MTSSFNSIPIEIIIFTGVAGAIDKKLKQWDIIWLIQLYNMIWMQDHCFKYVVPWLKIKIYPMQDLLKKLFIKLKNELNNKKLQNLDQFYKGLVALGICSYQIEK